MRRFLRVVMVCAFVGPLLPAQNIPLNEYRTRRAALRKDLDGVVVLFGKTVGNDEVFGFLQESNFYYLTGWTQPNAVLLIDKDNEILFLPHHDRHLETFTGRKASAEDSDARQLTGFDNVQPIEKFESELARALQSAEKVYAMPRQPGTEKLKTFLAFRDLSDAGPVIA
jgi:Xaa-Pro aminopeptidase